MTTFKILDSLQGLRSQSGTSTEEYRKKIEQRDDLPAKFKEMALQLLDGGGLDENLSMNLGILSRAWVDAQRREKSQQAQTEEELKKTIVDARESAENTRKIIADNDQNARLVAIIETLVLTQSDLMTQIADLKAELKAARDCASVPATPEE